MLVSIACVVRHPDRARLQPDGRVLMVSTNGTGLGHVTRLMAIARRLPEHVHPVIATESLAAPLLHQLGFLTEYIPSRRRLDVPRDRWNAYYFSRLNHLIDVYRPSVVVFDGVAPYSGLIKAVREISGIQLVWLRRAMWKKGTGQKWIERGRAFDHILEPGEFAESADQGATVPVRNWTHCVGPITLYDSHELLTRSAARDSLNLRDRPTALIQLGAGNINDLQHSVDFVVRHLLGKNVQVVLARSPIARDAAVVPDHVEVITRYPLSPYLRAFDVVVSAAGYNSFHELVGFGIPSVFLPNVATAYDDQVARVRYAAQSGAALWLRNPGSDDVLDAALDPDVQHRLSTRCKELSVPNGAGAAADWLVDVMTDRRPSGRSVPTSRATFLRSVRPMARLGVRRTKESVVQQTGSLTSEPVLSPDLPVRAYVALGVDAAALQNIIHKIRTGAAHGDHVPLLITDTAEFSVVAEASIPFEYIPPREGWNAYDDAMSWESLVLRRLSELWHGHQPGEVVVLSSSGIPNLGQWHR
jgi:UDP-N-acetylglucosamine:LPS N-acetylglucosamine transferase